ncbi:MAG: 50S ribosomal protein L17 [Dysgonamonadaceae bacterium]|nr:50S ribosomal protein L17 [Dysgonamonadaceae bacterium]MDD4729666.1 50S ribosomal protein L17 [Dysgonamonadaceae bacterium]
MRHNKKINHLGRTSAHRGAMLSNMSASLIMHKRIFTTVAKAKALKKVVEPIITRSKEDTTHSRRIVFSTLQSKEALTELFQNVSQKVGDRPGGYTRIIKTGHRLGDNAAMCFIELVDYNENMLKDSSAAKKPRTRRSRRKSSDSPVTATQSADKVKSSEEVEADKSETSKAKTPSIKEATPKKEEVKLAVKDEVKTDDVDTPEIDKE